MSNEKFVYFQRFDEIFHQFQSFFPVKPKVCLFSAFWRVFSSIAIFPVKALSQTESLLISAFWQVFSSISIFAVNPKVYHIVVLFRVPLVLLCTSNCQSISCTYLFWYQANPSFYHLTVLQRISSILSCFIQRKDRRQCGYFLIWQKRRLKMETSLDQVHSYRFVKKYLHST